ncbi:hypothetical protein A3464_06860 [Enterobacter genomosp. O]|nr:hypothetical protein A3464_06860 [Enterobacter genomosp. O]
MLPQWASGSANDEVNRSYELSWRKKHPDNLRKAELKPYRINLWITFALVQLRNAIPNLSHKP